jgi:hypothetical protein
MAHQRTDNAIARSRRIREAEPDSGSSRPPFKVHGRSPSIIGQSESNASMRSLLSGIDLKKKPRASPVPAPRSPRLSPTPLTFANAAAAIRYLESQFSRAHPEWLRATGVISVELSLKISEVARLQRECEAIGAQLRDQTADASAQRKLNACEDELEQALEQSRRALAASQALKDELRDVRVLHKTATHGLEEEVRRLRAETTTLRTSLRQKDISLDSAVQRQRSLEKDLTAMSLSVKEVEESCRDAVSKTKKVAEEERQRTGEIEQELSVAKARSRKARSDHDYALGRKARQVDTLKADLREKTLRTAARALNRMQKYSTWRAFAKMKGMVKLRKAMHLQGRASDVEAAERRVVALARAKQNAELQLARLKDEQSGFQEREKNMLNIISWLLDLHSSDAEEEQHNQAFLKELRSVYETAKMGVTEVAGEIRL